MCLVCLMCVSLRDWCVFFVCLVCISLCEWCVFRCVIGVHFCVIGVYFFVCLVCGSLYAWCVIPCQLVFVVSYIV